MPATKSALRGSPRAVICTSRFTKCCACDKICTSRFTKSALRGSPTAVRATKSALRGSQSAAPATKSALRGSQSAVPATKSALQDSQSAAPATKSARRGSQSAVPATKSANEPDVEKQRFTVPVTKSELVEDHHHVQSAATAMKTAVRSKTAPIPCACHDQSTLDHENTRFLLRLPRKVTTMCENAHGATTRAQSKCMWTIQRYECAVNNNELAVHARVTPAI